MVVINASELSSTVEKASSSIEPIRQVTGEVQTVNDSLGDITRLVEMVGGIIDKFMKLRSGGLAPALGGTQQNNFPMNGSPTQIRSSLPEKASFSPENNEVKNKEVIEVIKKVDRQKVKELLSDVIINVAKKLPDDIKEKKIGDVVGENFKDFKIKFMGFDVNAEKLLDIMTHKLADFIEENFEGENIDEFKKT